MPSKMMQFVRLDQQTPDKRSAQERCGDFDEIYSVFNPDRAGEQASRCTQCGIPFCQIHCPLGNNIPDWLAMAAAGRLREAYELASATNAMPEICGRICPQDRLCEGSCVLEQSGHHTVTIGAVERFVTDTAWAQGWVKPLQSGPARGQSIGIIGAGPAGLVAAEELRLRGFDVDVYDRYDRAGGLLVYGIPGFKLEKDVVRRRVQRLQDGGIVFHLGVDVGGTLSFSTLRERHDAILIATGVYRARNLSTPGSGLRGVVPALDYLIASSHAGFGDAAVDQGLDARDRHVVVIGGGDTAMDCVRTAVRQGARSVKCLYRRDRDNMPGSLREVSNAEEEGVEFVWLSAPEAFLDEGTPGHVSGVRAVPMYLGIPDASGRQTPRPVGDSHFVLPAGLVIEALGFDPEDVPTLFAEPALHVTEHGTLAVDPQTAMTSVEGVFAAGDIVRGASLVVWAIRDGREVAASIADYLEKRSDAGAVAGLGEGVRV
ncbi:NAD(P)-dependent oxidoreductase [Haematospirillum jordaniae]|uniref:Dihydropyrimidine dehydrogenase n=1 Tax=Haematospirillum jordaniae TaxID=1549855 RepID=A0A143DEC9_9PROT|nr:NAD(P)-dependent oxidoreductase [Haematospirillum jordaniae]AMW34468.1 dihydropyrimidine dehydrogenase [Haematospirillum jordaniae]NKD57815.1 NAD(P)-dependent oxidoreductase [Haematospirillum jordaniae]NKD59776.1 NAD(P)-dependent oxidoreductase [Haematospirillum jordaniae]NKD67643.1 NAD(P)-dependent oxidoreductase [Haematospirillum jordaniae]NKD79807.1 NAD(P)-dependent oxidoreductase [Haematospirillum jordaniae]